MTSHAAAVFIAAQFARMEDNDAEWVHSPVTNMGWALFVRPGSRPGSFFIQMSNSCSLTRLQSRPPQQCGKPGAPAQCGNRTSRAPLMG